MAQHFQLTADHRRWAAGARRKYHGTAEAWLGLIERQGGLCAFSAAPLLFDAASGTAVANGQGVHPLYAAVDHIAPGSDEHGHQIVSYDLNDLKGHLPLRFFRDLQASASWQQLMGEWRAQALKDSGDRSAFQRIRRS